MSTTIVSTTDTPEQIQAALGTKAEVSVIENPATAEKVVETAEASEALEIEDTEESDSTDESESSEVPKKKAGIQKRIDKLTKRASEAKRDADFWRAEALKAKNTPAEQRIDTPKTVDLSKRPKADGFESHDDYMEALVDWKADQKLAARDASAREADQRTRHEKQIASHQERAREFGKSHDDFEDVIAEVDDVPMSVTVQEVILASDNGPELMYELAKNKDEYKRICALPAIAAARELGRFEAKLQKSSSTETVEIKTKPKPISPISAKSSAIKDPDKMSFKEFEKWREQSLKKA